MAWRGMGLMAAAALCLAAPAVAHAQGTGSSGCVRMSRPGLLAESSGGRIVFDGGVERVVLTPVCGAPVAERIRAGAGKRFILLVDDLRARGASAAVFTLRLAESDGSLLSGDDAVLGSLNFFAARAPEAPGSQRRMSYDVTRTLRALAQAGRLDHGLVILLRPSEPPAPGAELSISRLQLVEQ